MERVANDRPTAIGSFLMNKKTPIAVCTTLLLALGLSACGSGEQSVDAACKVLNEEGKAAFGSLNASALQDPSALTSLVDSAKGVGEKITNTEVKGAWDGVVTDLDSMVQMLDGVDLSDPASIDEAKMEELTTKSTELQTTLLEDMNKLQELCPDMQ